MSAGEGILFADAMNDFSKKLNEIGPLGKSEGIDENALKTELQKVSKLVPYIKIVKNKKLSLRIEKEQEYNEIYTRDEIEELFRNVVSYHIAPDKCQACTLCLKACPVEAISGGKNLIHVIDQEKCIKCGTCFEACPDRFQAVMKFVGEPVPLPIAETDRIIVRKSKK
jgi:Na+-translocating ferredoxin:NAD+ oxidoreductase RNF subunit RnfB